MRHRSRPGGRFWIVVLLAVVVVASSCERVDRISYSASGGSANGESGPIREVRSGGGIAVDGTGRFVAFESVATNLLANGNAPGVFVRDQVTGAIEWISGGRHPSLSADGRYVAYADTSYGLGEVWVYDRRTGITTSVSGNAGDYNLNPEISADGRFVTWESNSSNLVAGFSGGIFVRDLVNRTTEVVSVNAAGTQPNDASLVPDISGDGRYVAFVSWATDLTPASPSTGWAAVFVRDRLLGVTAKVSVDSDGVPIDRGNSAPRINADGRFVAFMSDQEGLVVRDVVAGSTEHVAIGSDGTPGRGSIGGISADGRIVVFVSDTTTLVPNDTNRRPDVFARDRVRGTTSRLSLTSLDQQGSSGDSRVSAVSDDGRYAAFDSEDPLESDDTNGLYDVYIRPARKASIDGIAPATVRQGSTETLTVTGDGFLPGAGVSANFNGPGGVTVTGVQVVSDNEMHVTITVESDAPLDTRTVAMWNPALRPSDGANVFGFCVNCLTVT